MDWTIADFQRESNRIEGISSVRKGEIEALESFLQCEPVHIADLQAYVKAVQPNAVLRATPNVPGVRVGRHIAPPSGPQIVSDLEKILGAANSGALSAYAVHCLYETLHPFTDGNGRSGRALWLWMRSGNAPIGFLHQWYYETLDNLRERCS